jgi:acetoin:2,6-dichlorophenolindophenol oxidoreductase subunit alpha
VNTAAEGVPVRLYKTMTTIKLCDEEFRGQLAKGRIFIVYYSPRGQEAIAAAIGATLTRDDYLVTNYRGLHDHIAKGISLRDLCAEFLGRVGGTCKGKGGPMHITDPKNGIMVTTGIVGSGLPIGNGLALSSQLRGDGRVTVVTFGDGASNIGAFHEALNMAAIWDLPIVFVCQNNGYAEMSAFNKQQKNENVSIRATSYGMPGVTVDGNDPIASHTAMAEAVDRARSGGGPTLVEATTYRFWGHYLGDGMSYMPKEEREAAMAADPVPRFRRWLIDNDIAGESELAQIDERASAEVKDAFEFAHASPLPDTKEAITDVYAVGVPA